MDHKHYAGGGQSGSIPPPADQAVGEQPDNVWFADLMAEPLRRWAVAVAENFVWLAAQRHSLHTVEECWIDVELAMCVRYRNSAGRFGGRFDELYRSPISGPLSLTVRQHNSGSAVKQASNFLDVKLAGGPPDRTDWIEGDGRPWWGQPPAAGWESVLNPGTRLLTIPPP